MELIIALFLLLLTCLYKLSHLTVFHLEWGVLHLEFTDRRDATWVRLKIPTNQDKIARRNE